MNAVHYMDYCPFSRKKSLQLDLKEERVCACAAQQVDYSTASNL